MIKQIQAHKWSETFLELMGRKDKNLNMEEYEICVNEWKGAHESKMVRYYIYTIILFCGGLWAVYEQTWFMAVLLLALAANYNRQSSHHILMSEILDAQNLLAKLINMPSEQRSEQEKREGIEQEVSAFAETHPHFDELSDTIASLISEGMSLENAYFKALNEKQKNT
ncbi:MAG: hypothetical protein K8H75_08505 [Sulfuricella sp.]|nr:hypothetical protein [Sulfuricella sp.]